MADIFHHIVQQLSPVYGQGEARAMGRMLVEDLLGLSFTRVVAGLCDELPVEQKEAVDEAVARLLCREPIQYVIGRAQFCDHWFRVNPSVLIPRPETEQLVEIVGQLALPQESDGNGLARVRVMDACTGSGCIAVSLKLAHPDWQVEACDVSEAALDVACANAAENEADVRFCSVDVLSEVRPQGPFDVIVSNPPYVMQKEKISMESHVLEHEPALALFVDDENPLVFYNALADWGRASLKPGGWLAVEINAALGQQTADVFAQAGYADVQLMADMFNNERFVICRK